MLAQDKDENQKKEVRRKETRTSQSGEAGRRCRKLDPTAILLPESVTNEKTKETAGPERKKSWHLLYRACRLKTEEKVAVLKGKQTFEKPRAERDYE